MTENSTAADLMVGGCFYGLQKGRNIDKCREAFFWQFICTVVDFGCMYCLQFEIADNFLYEYAG